MATFRQIINRVLRTIAEDEVASSESQLTDSYHQLIATFINQIKEEIEDAHNWRDLSATHTATILANTTSATVVGANERSRLSRMNSENGLIPLVFDTTNPSDPVPLTEVQLDELRYRLATDPTGTTSTEPTLFALSGAGDGTLSIGVYPKPTTQRTITLTMFTPQARLEDSNLDTVVKIPSRPIEMGAIWYALMERGEEMGVNALFTEERYRKAVDDAIARDAEEQGGYELQIV